MAAIKKPSPANNEIKLNQNDVKFADSPALSDGDDDDNDENAELDPTGRWKKLATPAPASEETDAAVLAYDTELGHQVVWNEINFSAKENRRKKDRKIIERKFELLGQIKHENIVKFYGTWISENDGSNPKIVWITEFMTAGTLRKHLNHKKVNNMQISQKIWLRWCCQILSALRYMHECRPPLAHGNIKSSTIYVQHSGMIKIGAVCIQDIHNHVKTMKQSGILGWEYFAPEDAVPVDDEPEIPAGTVGGEAAAPEAPVSQQKVPLRCGQCGEIYITPSRLKAHLKDHDKCKADIFAFGIVALEMETLERPYSEYKSMDEMQKAKAAGIMPECFNRIERNEQPQQTEVVKDFIGKCLSNLDIRPTALQLLFHQCLNGVPKLLVFAAHRVVAENKRMAIKAEQSEQDNEDVHFDVDEYARNAMKKHAQKYFPNLNEQERGKKVQKLMTLITEVGIGLHPLTILKGDTIRPSLQPVPVKMPETVKEEKGEEGEEVYVPEGRTIVGEPQVNIIHPENRKDGNDSVYCTCVYSLNNFEAGQEPAKHLKRKLAFDILASTLDNADDIVSQMISCGLLAEGDRETMINAVVKEVTKFKAASIAKN
eukprot:m.47583 g.47583  ORF g.47583 m.47583 type:complete len:600 (-) comp10517_c0_seq1:637-2436(-)